MSVPTFCGERTASCVEADLFQFTWMPKWYTRLLHGAETEKNTSQLLNNSYENQKPYINSGFLLYVGCNIGQCVLYPLCIWDTNMTSNRTDRGFESSGKRSHCLRVRDVTDL